MDVQYIIIKLYSPIRCFSVRFFHDDVMKWKHFPHYWPFVRSRMNSPRKGQWRRALMFSLICGWINGWVNNRQAGDLGRHRAHYDVIVMARLFWLLSPLWWYVKHECASNRCTDTQTSFTVKLKGGTFITFTVGYWVVFDEILAIKPYIRNIWYFYHFYNVTLSGSYFVHAKCFVWNSCKISNQT